MSGGAKLLGLSAVAAVALVLILSGSVAATGSGYNQSYTQGSTTSNAAVGLTAVSSSYSSGPNLTASFTVAGAVNFANADYYYWVYFGGTASNNASGYADFYNNTTAGSWFSTSNGGYNSGPLAYVLSNGGSTVTFQMNLTDVGSSAGFAIDAYAEFVTDSALSYSWLGTDYNQGGGGGGSCTLSTCTSTAPASDLFGGFLLFAVIGIVVVVVVIVVVLLVVMRGRRPPTGAPPPMQQGWMPPQQPGMAPPPPQYQPMPPPPPPPGAA